MTQVEPILKKVPSDLERERTPGSGTRLIMSPQTQFKKEVSFRKTGTKIWELTPEVTSYSLIEEEADIALQGKMIWHNWVILYSSCRDMASFFESENWINEQKTYNYFFFNWEGAFLCPYVWWCSPWHLMSNLSASLRLHGNVAQIYRPVQIPIYCYFYRHD